MVGKGTPGTGALNRCITIKQILWISIGLIGTGGVHIAYAAGVGPIIELDAWQKIIEQGMVKTAFTVVSQCNVEGLTEVLQASPSVVSARDERGDTLLHWAAYRGWLPGVRLLLQQGANVRALNNNKDTALYRAAVGATVVKEHGACMRLMLESDAKHMQAIAQEVAGQKPVPLVAMRTEQVETPLHAIARTRFIEGMRLLLAARAEVAAVDKMWRTPLHVAAVCDSSEDASVLACLLCAIPEAERRAVVNGIDSYGDTPLHNAAQEGSPERVRLLLGNGADVAVINKRGETPTQVAEQCRPRRDTHVHGASADSQALPEALRKRVMRFAEVIAMLPRAQKAVAPLEKLSLPQSPASVAESPASTCADSPLSQKATVVEGELSPALY